MLELRIVKTLETVLARFTRCGMFLARFYNACLRESLHSKMKKRDAVSVCKECLMMLELRIVKTLETVLARYNNDVMPDLFGHRLLGLQKRIS